ncbi:hypothetical protein BDZ89DRAFT_1048321 [Hymenopellis radicata]|nr:hypothetical protein BDZ89DRAFT_1048321 [Hymenopellis radicata]
MTVIGKLVGEHTARLSSATTPFVSSLANIHKEKMIEQFVEFLTDDRHCVFYVSLQKHASRTDLRRSAENRLPNVQRLSKKLMSPSSLFIVARQVTRSYLGAAQRISVSNRVAGLELVAVLRSIFLPGAPFPSPYRKAFMYGKTSSRNATSLMVLSSMRAGSFHSIAQMGVPGKVIDPHDLRAAGVVELNRALPSTFIVCLLSAAILALRTTTIMLLFLPQELIDRIIDFVNDIPDDLSRRLFPRARYHLLQRIQLRVDRHYPYYSTNRMSEAAKFEYRVLSSSPQARHFVTRIAFTPLVSTHDTLNALFSPPDIALSSVIRDLPRLGHIAFHNFPAMAIREDFVSLFSTKDITHVEFDASRFLSLTDVKHAFITFPRLRTLRIAHAGTVFDSWDRDGIITNPTVVSIVPQSLESLILDHVEMVEAQMLTRLSDIGFFPLSQIRRLVLTLETYSDSGLCRLWAQLRSLEELDIGVADLLLDPDLLEEDSYLALVNLRTLSLTLTLAPKDDMTPNVFPACVSQSRAFFRDTVSSEMGVVGRSVK